MSTVLFGAILAWIAVMIYASSNSIVTLLTQIGEVHQVMGRNAITFCNLLALGSLISLIPMVIFFHKDWTRDNLRALTIRDWSLLTVSAVLSSAVTPGLFFYALEYTTVTNVVLIGRIDPPLFILASSNEILMDDAVHLAERCIEAGVETECHVWPRLPHAFPLFERIFPEARQALDEMVEFTQQHLPGTMPGTTLGTRPVSGELDGKPAAT